MSVYSENNMKKNTNRKLASLTLPLKKVTNIADAVLYWLIGLFCTTALISANSSYFYMKQEL